MIADDSLDTDSPVLGCPSPHPLFVQTPTRFSHTLSSQYNSTDLDRSRAYQLQSVSAGSLDISRDNCDSNVGPVGITLLSKAGRRSGMASRVHHDLPWRVSYTMTAHDYISYMYIFFFYGVLFVRHVRKLSG